MTTLSLALIGLAMMIPQVDAQGRNSHNGKKDETHQVTTGNRNNRNKNNGVNNRPSNRPSNRPGGNQGVNNRPGGNHNKPDHGVNNHPNNKPNHNWGNGNHRPNDRPGGNHNWGNGNHRPNDRPGGNHNWGNGNHRPGNNWHFGGNHHGFGAPPMRPHRPVAHPWRPPVPPHHWRPRPHAPNIAAILGVTFGTALNISLNYLVNNGYYIDGYANNTVYLRDINQFNYYWPDATLYYGNGGLARSEFLYSTSYPDMMRYNSLYNSFMMTYGNPVSVSTGPSLSATWFAPNRGYITLNYGPQYSMGGQMRYFTTLTIGL